MSKWKQLEEKLQGAFSNVELRAGGHSVTLRQRLYKRRLVIEPWVDGAMKGEWFQVDEERKPKHSEGRFWRPMRARAYRLKDYKAIKKAFGKRQADDMTSLKVVGLMPFWESPRSLIAHLKREFPDLELVEETGS